MSFVIALISFPFFLLSSSFILFWIICHLFVCRNTSSPQQTQIRDLNLCVIIISGDIYLLDWRNETNNKQFYFQGNYEIKILYYYYQLTLTAYSPIWLMMNKLYQRKITIFFLKFIFRMMMKLLGLFFVRYHDDTLGRPRLKKSGEATLFWHSLVQGVLYIYIYIFIF